ncbi:hypothetical protein FKV68_32810 (plasmid) [Sinorhizobium mexicanum]|uniref:Lytic murein transglycosylase n=1 Tax=Sinorhizobium mexicanum TaxID=375549 RepID=A0A859QJY7_9HYPH|nr:hypothetical protein FKV68_32810 [Sinorhizobium mexicanum]
MRTACVGTPLCPAGHLPHKGGDRQAAGSPFSIIDRAGLAAGGGSGAVGASLISPLVGEMPGRAEGGAAMLSHEIVIQSST